jgi:hypothetical protein
MPEIAGMEGAYFVFAHIICPHTPYVFGPNGEEIRNIDPYTLLDAHPGNEENLRLYRDQVNYLNQLVLKAIDGIISRSRIPPIIILQGDHGSKVFRELHPPENIRMQLLFPILNAYRLPEEDRGEIYGWITPVNTFRYLLSSHFGIPVAPEQDTSYVIETIRHQVVFEDACTISNIDCQP